MNPQPHRSSTSCNRHPQEENFTGFCPSCLCERLTVLHPNSSSSHNNPSTLKSFFPELRRTKSFSASKNDTFSSAFQPQRKSCDVRARTSLFFNDNKTLRNDQQEQNENPEEIRVLEEPDVNLIEEEGKLQELKTMKDHIDLNSSQSKKASKDSKGGFWSAASVFSNKLQKWRHKQKTKKHHHGNQNDDVSATLPVEKPMSRQFRDTQSEIADYGFGRRSCDTDPRFSLDIGRVSFDDNNPRYSFDEPRASLDSYLIGRTTFPRMPTMLSVVEDDAPVTVLRTDTQIPVEEHDDGNVPGGCAQTREYYDSSSRRRKSLDRSNSVRKTMDELKCGGVVDDNTNTNAKVNPASVDYIHAAKMGGFVDGDCCSETIELGFRDNGASVIGNGDGDRKGSKKSRLRWSKAWSIWGFIKGGNKDDDRYTKGNGVERSFSGSWQDLRGDGNGDNGRGGAFNGRLLRSNSSVSWRNAPQSMIGGSFGTIGSNGVKGNGHGKKGKDEFVLERNKSARYSPSPSNIDNGLLRFYLTPMTGSRRNGSVKSRSNQAHSVATSVPRLY